MCLIEDHFEEVKGQKIPSSNRRLSRSALQPSQTALHSRPGECLSPTPTVDRYLDEIQIEDGACRRRIKNGNNSKQKPVSPLRDTVEASTLIMNLSAEEVRFWIATYGARNERFHPGLKEPIRNIDWQGLISKISEDFKETEELTPKSRQGDRGMINKTIHKFQSLYISDVYSAKDGVKIVDTALSNTVGERPGLEYTLARPGLETATIVYVFYSSPFERNGSPFFELLKWQHSISGIYSASDEQ
ncbi:MAG: hypothetical protein M1817_003776 [Caeruleum heppii]|nr:MAG: hypothetical protein M1817_003776 [Caeruleum heppii]